MYSVTFKVKYVNYSMYLKKLFFIYKCDRREYINKFKGRHNDR